MIYIIMKRYNESITLKLDFQNPKSVGRFHIFFQVDSSSYLVLSHSWISNSFNSNFHHSNIHFYIGKIDDQTLLSLFQPYANPYHKQSSQYQQFTSIRNHCSSQHASPHQSPLLWSILYFVLLYLLSATMHFFSYSLNCVYCF